MEPIALVGGQLAFVDGADSVLIEDGRIARVAARQEILRAAPPTAEVIPLEGRILSPGFHDAHFHFLQMGITASRPSLRECGSASDVLDATGAAAQHLPEPRMLILEGWDQSGWSRPAIPTRAEVDAVVPDRAVILRRVCGHLGVANTKALELLQTCWRGGGLDADSGLLEEGPVLHLEELFPPGREEIRPAIAASARTCLSLGITTAADFLRPGACRSYRESGGDLPVRLNAFVLDECLDEPGLLDELPRTERFRLRGIKIFSDGSIGARTAALLDPYSDRPASRGALIHTRQELVAAIRRGHARNLAVAVHAIGDRAIGQVLDAFSKLPAEEIAERRHRIEHFELPGPGDLKRLRELGVRPCVQPNFVGQWAGPGGLYETALGAERLERMNPFRALLRGGTGVFFGSDGMPPSPLYGIRSAVSHPVESERLSWEDAHRLYTEAPARALGDDPLAGQIAVGATADLVVLPPNPQFEKGSEVDLTILAGKVVHRRGSP